MGNLNCVASSHRPRLEDDDAYDGFDNYENMNKELRDPFSIEKIEHTENTTSSFSEGMDGRTAPLSPLSPPSSTAVIHEESLASGSFDKLSQQLVLARESDDVLSPLSSDRYSPQHQGRRSLTSSSLALNNTGSATSPRRRGRALQARLQKARNMQMALIAAPNGQHGRYSMGGERSYSNRSVNSSSSCNRSVNTTEGSSDEYEPEILSKTSVWAELELDSAVLCTALSRNNTASLNTLPLHIAVGTESGSVVVQELLSQQPDILYLPAPPPNSNPEVSMTTPTDTSSQRLGLPISVQVEGRVRSLDFSPDGQYLAVGGDDCRCSIYRLVYQTNEDQLHQLTLLEWVMELERIDRVYAVQFSPDSRYLAIGGFDGTVAIIATADISSELSLEVITEIPRDGLIFTVDWSPDSRYLAIGGSDKCCAVVDCKTSWKVFREIRRPSTVQVVKWYPTGTGRFLAIGCAETVAIVVGRDGFALMNEIDLRKKNAGRGRSVYRTNAICWSPSGSYLVVCGSGRKCTLYETKGFTIVHEIPRSSNITSVVWGQQRSIAGGVMLPRPYLAIGGEDHKAVILQAPLEQNMSSGGSSIGGDDLSSAASSAYFSTRGDWVLKENAFEDLEDIKEITMPPKKESQIDVPESPGEATVICVAFSKGSKSRPSAYFAHSTNDGLVTVRFGADWKVVAEIQFPKPVNTMTFSTGSKYLALGCEDANVYVSDTIANWELVAKIEFAAPVSTLCFSGKNNERLAVGSVDSTFAFLDPRKGFDFAGELVDNEFPVVAADWNSRNLAVGREDGSVSIFSSQEVINNIYDSVAEIQRNAAVRAVSFGVSSRFLAVGDAGGLIGVYSAKGDWVLCHQVQMNYCVSSLCWCPLGRHLAYSGDNGAIKVIETIFWAEVAEANAAATPSEDGSLVNSSLSFSQDGKLLAFGRSDRGLGIMDSTANWALSLNLMRGQQKSQHFRELDDASSSSISSREDVENSQYEV